MTSNIATAINAAHAAAETAKQALGEAAAECGRLLTEAKATVPHGGWDAWVQQHCRFSLRTAQLYMRIHRELSKDPAKAQRVADLSIREMAKVLAEPAPATESAAIAAAWNASDKPAQVRFVDSLLDAGEISPHQHRRFMQHVTPADEAAERVARMLADGVPKELWPRLAEALAVAETAAIIREMERIRPR